MVAPKEYLSPHKMNLLLIIIELAPFEQIKMFEVYPDFIYNYFVVYWPHQIFSSRSCPPIQQSILTKRRTHHLVSTENHLLTSWKYIKLMKLILLNRKDGLHEECQFNFTTNESTQKKSTCSSLSILHDQHELLDMYISSQTKTYFKDRKNAEVPACWTLLGDAMV
jgi:hypothetical protein